MRKIFAASALVAMLVLSGCTAVNSGKIVDKVRENGRTEWDCDTKTSGTGKNKTTKKVCGWETQPDNCKFQLDDGKYTAWLEVTCQEYDQFQVGQQYP